MERSTSRSDRDLRSSEEMVEELVEDVRLFASEHEPRETQEYLGLEVNGQADNFVVFRPRSYGVQLDIKVQENDPVIPRLQEEGCEVLPYRAYESGPGIYPVRITFEQFARLRPLLREALVAAYRTGSRRR